MILRPCRPTDAAVLLSLCKDTIRRVNSRDYAPDQIAAWASDEIDPALWANRFEGRFALVAEVDDIIAGFVDMTPEGYLDRLFVSADHQGQGIATALIEAVFAEAIRLGLSKIDVQVSLTARPFFEKQGFVITENRRVEIRGAMFDCFGMECTMPIR
jgi:putative acetyltransferase